MGYYMYRDYIGPYKTLPCLFWGLPVILTVARITQSQELVVLITNIYIYIYTYVYIYMYMYRVGDAELGSPGTRTSHS